ncbi:hypothetical protein GUITHDRAFT_68154 [Guillardia theta CCMP2712]|uniref:Uncharacterized protein n=1 Tax=Guillardia theta (strain CCMP2712) TaxID=905079 RepID=L1JKE7_GUITC|nr:hypothetical protein GUITHDRAFT_68154 [Guillardia theta CCMP2712]EKX48971.1 hypothetical protein GUITHDRAFT_68154 [Guillardia theta CCMP2712]|eukprot:XP_005835951.1 hypothetical protein GUITHDRAFT_68154 [Guillardia theta CCMP2712]
MGGKLPVIPLNPREKHTQPIVDFNLEENLLQYVRPSRWVAINVGDFPLLRFNWVVSLLASVILWVFIIVVLTAQDNAQGINVALLEFNNTWQPWITQNFTWFYIFTQDIWCVFVVYIAFSKYGNIKLGKDDEKPAFSDFSWFVMLFCSGIAVGFYFYGVREPLTYYRASYYNVLYKPGWLNDDQRAQQAIFITLYHWGIHAWACYIIVAMVLGFVAFRWDRPLTLRQAFFPLVGHVIDGFVGDIIDSVAMACTTFGVCTSLGFGVMTMVHGLRRIDCGKFDMPTRTFAGALMLSIVGAIWIITLIATVSVVTGLNHGIKALSLVAFGLGNMLLVMLLLTDDTWFLLNSYVQSLGHYITYVIQVGFECDTWPQLNFEFRNNGDNKLWDSGSNKLYDTVTKAIGRPLTEPDTAFGSQSSNWIGWWTIFYWGWWISWAPFVGMFVATISRGRTLRQIFMGAIAAPIFYSFFFLVVMGSLGIKMERVAELSLLDPKTTNYEQIWKTGMVNCTAMGYSKSCFWTGDGQPQSVAARKLAEVGYYALPCRNPDDVFFDVMEPYGKGIATYLKLISVIGVVLYFVTSSDSGSYVDDILSAGGMAHPPVLQRVYWAITEGACATAILYAGGSDALTALRAVSICSGLPLTIAICLMCTALLRACKYDMMEEDIHSSTRFIVGLFDWADGFQPAGIPSELEPGLQRRIRSLVISIFAPFITIHKVHHKFYNNVAIVHTAITGMLFITWIGCMIGEVGTTNAAYVGWTMYIFFAAHLTATRLQARLAYKVYGSAFEDFFACLIMYPFVISQLDLQVESQVEVHDEDAPAPYRGKHVPADKPHREMMDYNHVMEFHGPAKPISSPQAVSPHYSPYSGQYPSQFSSRQPSQQAPSGAPAVQLLPQPEFQMGVAPEQFSMAVGSA